MRGEVQSRPALCGALLANTGRHTFILTGWLSCGPVVGSLEPVPNHHPRRDLCPRSSVVDMEMAAQTTPKGRACCPAAVSPRDSHRELSSFQWQVHRWLMAARA